MPVLTQGNTANITIGANDSITLQNRSGQSASLTVAGVLVNGQHSGTRTYGPYTNGGAVVIVATAGDVYYEVGDGAYAGVSPALVEVDTSGRPLRTVTPDGQVVGGGGAGTPSNIWALKAIGQTINSSGTSVHQQRVFAPFGGETIDVALEFYNASTSTQAVMQAARVAASSSFDLQEPDGAWQVLSSGLTVPVARAAGRFNTSRTEWVRLYLPPDASAPGWGSIYARSRAQSGAWHYGLNQSNLYDTAAVRFKSRNDFEAIAIDGTFSSPTVQSMIRQCTVLIRPVAAKTARTLAGFGDSRTAGQGSTSDQYGWMTRAVESIAVDGGLVGVENHGVPGTTTATFQERFESRVRSAQVDAVFWQPASTNDATAWTESTVTECMARTAAVYRECQRRGVEFVTSTMYPSVAADTADKAAQWARLNNEIRAAYPGRVIDFAASALTISTGGLPAMNPALAADNPARHCNNAGHALCADLAKPVFARLLGVS